MLKVYGRATSDSTQKVLWMAGETDQPFEHMQLGGGFGGLDDPAYLRLNPHGRIPTIVDDTGNDRGDVVVWESNAIIRYLAATYCAGTLWADEPAQRARADQWMAWGQSRIYPDFNKLFWLTVRTPQDEQDSVLITEINERLTTYYQLLDTHLAAHEFVAGDEFSIGDIPTGMTLFRYFNMPIERPSLPNVERWYRRLSERPPYRKYVMASFEELRGRLTF